LPNNHLNWNKNISSICFALGRKRKKISFQSLNIQTLDKWIKGRFYTYHDEIDIGSEKTRCFGCLFLIQEKNNQTWVEGVSNRSFNKWYPVGMVYVKKNGNKIESDTKINIRIFRKRKAY
jgi:hypothetical protein